MKKNLIENKPETIFIYTTYKIIPPGLKNYKFFVILGYDKLKNKLILYLFSLIKSENNETFEANYIKLKYEFNPKYINTDFQKGQIKAINSSFPQ